MKLPDFSQYTNAELVRYVQTVGGTGLERELVERLIEWEQLGANCDRDNDETERGGSGCRECKHGDTSNME